MSLPTSPHHSDPDRPPPGIDETYLLNASASIGYAVGHDDVEPHSLIGLHLHRDGQCHDVVVAMPLEILAQLSEQVMTAGLVVERIIRDGFDPASPPDPEVLHQWAEDRIALLKVQHEHLTGHRDVNAEPLPGG